MSKRVALRSAGGAVAGLAGALLTAYGPFPAHVSLDRGFSLLSGGLWFGAALALYLLVTRKATPRRAAGFVVLSWVAYAMAMCAAIGTGLIFAAFDLWPFIAAGSMVGGAVGGLVLATGMMFRLYSPGPSARATRARLVCGVGGAILGVVGARLAIVPHPPPLEFSTLKLCLVWQTGMGLLLGATSLERDPER